MAEVFDFGLQQHKIKMDGKFFENNLFAVAGDTGRRLEVQLLDSNNLVQNTTGISLRLNADVAGQATYAEATLVDATKGLYELDLPNGMLIAPGNWQFQWQIIGANGEKLHSFAFMGSVGSNLSEGGTEATNFYLNVKDLEDKANELLEEFIKVQQDSTTTSPSGAEVVVGRSSFPTLGERLDNIERGTTQRLNISAMSTDNYLKSGDIVETIGFSDIFDKGGSHYVVGQYGGEVSDGYSLIDLTNGLKAKMITIGAINAKSFGARGNNINDDSDSIQRAISFAESFKDDTTLDRFEKGLTVKLPDGTYKVTDTTFIRKSNVRLQGESYSGTTIYARDSNFDMIVFDGTEKALYGSNITDIRLFSPGNSTGGTQLRFLNVINSINTDVELSGGFEALEVNGGGKIYFNNFLITQTNRTAGTPTGHLLKVLGDYGIPGDIHFTDMQITPNYTNQENTAIIRSCDGLYFNNFHIHGGLLIEPRNTGNEKTLASVFFNNSYFDTALVNNITFGGSADTYRNFFFTNSYIRDAARGIYLAPSTVMKHLVITGGKVSEHDLSGVFQYSDRTQNMKINNTIFENNNTNNVATEGDVIISGQKNYVMATSHLGGGANGYAIHFKSSSANCGFDNTDVVESTSTKLIVDEGSANGRGTVYGSQKSKNTGSATLAIGQIKVTIPHGVSFPITGTNILLTPRTPLSNGAGYWISDVTSTSFAVNLQSAPTQSVIFTWSVDATR